MSGPLSRAIKGSPLANSVRPGLQAIPGGKRDHIAAAVRTVFADSLDLDAATRPQHPDDPRWDYLLGHASSSQVVALETHPAETSHVSLVIEKRAASRRHLQAHLRPGETIAAWYWAASGRSNFAPHETVVNRLNQHGIELVGGRLDARHLASLPSQTGAPAPRPQRTRSRKPRR